MNLELNHIQNGSKPAQWPDDAQISKKAKRQRPKDAALSPRQTDIARLVAMGLSDKQIGTKLKLTEGTVGWHLNNIFLKWQIHSRIALTVRFLQDMAPKRTASESPPNERQGCASLLFPK